MASRFKLFFIFSITIALFPSTFLKAPEIVIAQSSCIGGDIHNFSATPDGTQVTFNITDAAPTSSNRTLYILIDCSGLTGSAFAPIPISIDTNGNGSATATIPTNGDYTALVYSTNDCRTSGSIVCSSAAIFAISAGAPPTDPITSDECRNLGESCVPGVTPLCDPENTKCATLDGSQYSVFRKDDPAAAGGFEPIAWRIGGCPITTALGDLPCDDINLFTAKLLQIFIGIGGGIAFLLMLFGSLQVILSSGNPDKTKAGQQLITSAISGLLFIIFSLLILELIGVKILNIPGFGQ